MIDSARFDSVDWSHKRTKQSRFFKVIYFEFGVVVAGVGGIVGASGVVARFYRWLEHQLP